MEGAMRGGMIWVFGRTLAGVQLWSPRARLVAPKRPLTLPWSWSVLFPPRAFEK